MAIDDKPDLDGSVPSCAFCGLPWNEVGRLIQGRDASICDACIRLCSEMLQDDGAETPPAGETEARDDASPTPEPDADAAAAPAHVCSVGFGPGGDRQLCHAAIAELTIRWKKEGFRSAGKHKLVRDMADGVAVIVVTPPGSFLETIGVSIRFWFWRIGWAEQGHPPRWPFKVAASQLVTHIEADLGELAGHVAPPMWRAGPKTCVQQGLGREQLADLVWDLWDGRGKAWLAEHSNFARELERMTAKLVASPPSWWSDYINPMLALVALDRIDAAMVLARKCLSEHGRQKPDIAARLVAASATGELVRRLRAERLL